VLNRVHPDKHRGSPPSKIRLVRREVPHDDATVTATSTIAVTIPHIGQRRLRDRRRHRLLRSLDCEAIDAPACNCASTVSLAATTAVTHVLAGVETTAATGADGVLAGAAAVTCAVPAQPEVICGSSAASAAFAARSGSVPCHRDATGTSVGLAP
jgi:hypothetical protein